MNDNTAKLLTMIHNNPDLPIVCMVDGDVVGDDYGRWVASIGYCEVGEYVLYNERYYTDRDEFEEEYYEHNDEILDERFGYNPSMTFPNALNRYKEEDIEANIAAEGRLDEYIKEVANKAFRRAILVNIDAPDDYVAEEFPEEVRNEIF